MPVRAVVTDIEGTTTSVSFVYDVLFPYARTHIPGFVRANAAALSTLLDDVRREAGEPSLDVEGCIAMLLRWMDEDRKITPLKTLQGLVWKEGYEAGGAKGHLYPDVAPCLRRWKADGLMLCVRDRRGAGRHAVPVGSSGRAGRRPRCRLRRHGPRPARQRLRSARLADSGLVRGNRARCAECARGNLDGAAAAPISCLKHTPGPVRASSCCCSSSRADRADGGPCR